MPTDSSPPWRIQARPNAIDRSQRPFTAATLIAYENETWRLIKQKDLKGFANYLAEDFLRHFS
jgi:hypothetical protein